MKKNKFTVFLVLAFFFCAPCLFAQTSNYQFSRNFSDERVNLLRKDLESVWTVAQSSGLKRTTELRHLSSETLKVWLAARLHYFATEQDANGDRTLFLTFDDKFSSGKILVNIGTSLYLQGKSAGYRMGFRFPFSSSDIDVPITTPRVGLLALGELFFSEMVNPQAPERVANRIRRLSHLFHEARHSDGHNESLGFPHVVCPTGHTYAGRIACDPGGNGAFAISSYFEVAAARACLRDEGCTRGEIELLYIEASDSKDRILNKQYLDGTPERL